MKKRENKKNSLLIRLSPIALLLAINAPAYSQDLDAKILEKNKVKIDNTYVHVETPLLDDKVVIDSKKIDELNGVIIDREKEISTLQSKVTDLTIQVDKKSNTDKVETDVVDTDVVDTDVVDTDVVVTDVVDTDVVDTDVVDTDVVEDEDAIARAERIKELEKKNAELENSICEQENKMAKLEQSMAASSQNILGPLMMQQQMSMMSMFMNSGFPMTFAPSYSSGNDSLRMEMMLQSMRFENSISNMNSNMFSMMGLMSGMNSAPTYNVGGDYIGGNYSMTNPAQMQVQAQTQAMNQQQAIMQGSMAMTNPYAMNLNQDQRTGNTKSRPQTEKQKADLKKKSTESELNDLKSAGLANA